MSTSHDRHDGQPEWDAVRAEDDRYLGWRDLTVWKTAAGRMMVTLARQAARWIGPYPVLALTLLIGVALAVALTAASVEIYEAVAEADGIAGLDQPVLQAAIAVRTPSLDTAVTAFTNLGGPVVMPILAAVVAITLAIRRRQVSPVVLMAVATAGSLLMTIVGKALVGRIRPPLADAVPPYESSPSFPSGHALNAMVVAGVVAYLLVLRQQQWRTRTATVAAALAFAVAMGLSRVFLGHHWLTDVLVAWTLGLAWLAVVITIHRLYLSVRPADRPQVA
ncbi:undecaprenyl-diphosphatase [Micromonospora viridifaciens]|uniref:Undecaprenyl-diphosphatase n=1 Tax=Micromonospora viridifaciens TaxID=1881 RepID=A0A1C4X345_MICVI|nr:phosphatase PAP2 family protein [Micromonospora viridifaciens]SCF02895.1 undecaprenyl-diphosphatase [Micromonospora viridifaciens]